MAGKRIKNICKEDLTAVMAKDLKAAELVVYMIAEGCPENLIYAWASLYRQSWGDGKRTVLSDSAQRNTRRILEKMGLARKLVLCRGCQPIWQMRSVENAIEHLVNKPQKAPVERRGLVAV